MSTGPRAAGLCHIGGHTVVWSVWGRVYPGDTSTCLLSSCRVRAALGSRGDPDVPLEMTPGALESSRRTLVSVLRREPLGHRWSSGSPPSGRLRLRPRKPRRQFFKPGTSKCLCSGWLASPGRRPPSAPHSADLRGTRVGPHRLSPVCRGARGGRPSLSLPYPDS